MGRQVKRVPVGFGWPQGETWPGYLLPDWLTEQGCSACGEGGWSPRAQELYDRWYGNAPFRPEDNGSTPLTADTHEVRELARRNANHARDLGHTCDEDREAQRLADLFNGQWSYHLNEDDVAALAAARYVKDDATVEEVNRAAITDPLSRCSTHAHRCIIAVCDREGVTSECPACGGHGSVEKWPGQRATADAWEGFDPPTGDGWQMWENTSEGSPMSPVFETADALIDWLVDTGASYFGSTTASREQWRAVVMNDEPAMVQIAPGVVAM